MAVGWLDILEEVVVVFVVERRRARRRVARDARLEDKRGCEVSGLRGWFDKKRNGRQ